MSINALGKSGETYYTHCNDKAEVKKWIADNEHKLSKKDIKITNKNRHPLFNWFSL